MSYIIILLTNCLFILYSIMFFVDHSLVPASTGARIKNLLLLCATLYVIYNLLFIYILKKQNEQSGIIYKIASTAKHAAVNTYTFIQPFQKEFIVSLVIAAAIIIISFILVGLPGGLILGLLQKIGIGNTIQGDNVWPAALYVSFFWPLCFPVAVLVKNYLIQQGFADQAFSGLWISGAIWILIIVTSAFLLFGTKPMRVF